MVKSGFKGDGGTELVSSGMLISCSFPDNERLMFDRRFCKTGLWSGV